MTGQSLIEYRDIAKEFVTRGRRTMACEHVNLTVRAGEFLAIVGPSGCGKSTLLNMAAGLTAPSAGTVTYRGAPVGGVNTRVSYMTQRDTLFPWRTAEDNVAISLELQGVAKQERRRIARDHLARVGLKDFEAAYPANLSGGMRRRVILARTLACQPETLLMDEPFGALDAQLRLVMHDQLLEIWSKTQTTVLFVTHDLEEAIALADRVAIFSARPGHVLAVEDVPLPRPRDVFRLRFSAEFSALHDRLWHHLGHAVRQNTGEAA